MAELHVLNDEWHLLMLINRQDKSSVAVTVNAEAGGWHWLMTGDRRNVCSWTLSWTWWPRARQVLMILRQR